MKKEICFVVAPKGTIEILKKVAVGDIPVSKLRLFFNQRTYELSIPTINKFSHFLRDGELLLMGESNIEGRRQKTVQLNKKLIIKKAGNDFVVLEVDE